jgi:hypothetical protein
MNQLQTILIREIRKSAITKVNALETDEKYFVDLLVDYFYTIQETRNITSQDSSEKILFPFNKILKLFFFLIFALTKRKY